VSLLSNAFQIQPVLPLTLYKFYDILHSEATSHPGGGGGGVPLSRYQDGSCFSPPPPTVVWNPGNRAGSAARKSTLPLCISVHGHVLLAILDEQIQHIATFFTEVGRQKIHTLIRSDEMGRLVWHLTSTGYVTKNLLSGNRYALDRAGRSYDTTCIAWFVKVAFH